MANLHCECQELKPKVETNSSFLVLHPPLGVDIVNTVGSHLKRLDINEIIGKLTCEIMENKPHSGPGCSFYELLFYEC